MGRPRGSDTRPWQPFATAMELNAIRNLEERMDALQRQMKELKKQRQRIENAARQREREDRLKRQTVA